MSRLERRYVSGGKNDIVGDVEGFRGFRVAERWMEICTLPPRLT